MGYVIKAVLSNPRRPECGQITIPFPIPADQYDQTIEMLQEMDLGYSVNRDCRVDEVDSHYHVLGSINGTLVNVDQLDYLAKRLDSFCVGEDEQFQAMAWKLKLTDIKDLINLTFCSQRATVITDFSNLEAVGRSHFINLNGGGARMEELESLDGIETALLLIDSGGETVTPYGVVYDNGMKLEQVYNGRQLPAYPYDSTLMVLEVTPKRGLAEGDSPEYLYLPASERQIERTLLRVGITALHEAQVRLDFDELPEKAAEALDLDHLSGEDLPALNRMCRAIASLNEADTEKLNAVVLMTETSGIISICRLAENLDQFSFVPGIQTPEEYGKYMIRESGHFDYDENLEGFYDYRRYGEQRIRQEGGQFNECGYVMDGVSRAGQLELPAPLDDFKRQMDTLRPPASDHTLHVSSVDSPIPSLSWHLSHTILDSDPTLQKLNQLAEVIDNLNAAGLYHLSKSLNPEFQQSLDDVLRIASHIKPCNMDFYEVIPGVTTEQELGKWLVEHDRLEEKVPESLRPYLDYRSIGTDYRSTHEGEFLAGGYTGIRTGAIGQVLEEQSVLQLTLVTADQWYYLTLPASEEEMTQAKRDLDVEDFSQAGITAVKFSAPQLNSLIPLDTVSVEDANALALCLKEMEQEDGEEMKFCAMLEVEQPETFAEALKIAMNRDDYELVPENAEEYGKQVLRRIGADDEIIDTIDGYMDFAQLGSDSLAEDGVRRTEFGLIRRLSNPFPPEPEIGQAML